jgi:HAD superfamily hydrolase (TIGR01509 family)
MRAKYKKIAGIKWIFFDLDGTLINTIQALYKIYLDFLNDFNKKGSRKEFEMLSGSLSEIIKILKSKYKLRSTERSLLKLYRDKLSNHYDTKIKPIADAELILQKLNKSNFKLMLVTSASHKLADKLLSRLGWGEYFQNYVFGNEVKISKPDPTIYRLALKKAGITSKDALAIEDSFNGVVSASRAGLLVIGFANIKNQNRLFEAGASVVIHKLKDILKIFDEENNL